MKKSGQSKMKVQLYEGLLVVVIIVVIVVLILAVRSDKKNIEKTFDNTLTYIKKSARLQNILKKSMQNGFRKTKNGMIWQQYPEQTVRELYFATVIRIQTV